MVVKSSDKFISLMSMVGGHTLVDAQVVKHKDASGDYEEIILEFKDDKNNTSKVSFTSNWEYRESDKDIIDTTVDADIARMIFNNLSK